MHQFPFLLRKDFLSLLFLIFLFGCKKDPETIELKPAGNSNLVERTATTLIAYLYANNVWVIGSDGTGKKQLTTSNTAYSEVAISPDNSQIAYLDSGRTPVIIDKNGNVIKRLGDYHNAKSLGWSWDSKTLYFISNNKVVFEGPALPIKLPDFSAFFPAPTLRWIAISPQNYFAYSYNYGSIFVNEGTLTLLTDKDSISFEGYTDSFERLKFAGDGKSLSFYSARVQYMSIYHIENKYFDDNANDFADSFAPKRDNTELLYEENDWDSTFLKIKQYQGYKGQDLTFDVLSLKGGHKLTYDWK